MSRKQLPVTMDGVEDSTGYLFSFAKSLSAALRNSRYADYCEDIVAASGFSFRMWVAADLCPSAMSIWSFHMQKPWVENGGLLCGYVERLWGQEDIEEAKRLEAIEMIKAAINNGVAAVSWEIGMLEWGLITGYDDDSRKFTTLAVNGLQGELDYDELGKGEIPLLNILTITGESGKSREAVIIDTLKLAASHLRGEEWCDNVKGLSAYPALISFFEREDTQFACCWNMEYYLGTYGALKWYSRQFFEKYGLPRLASLYDQVYACWMEAFRIKREQNMNLPETRTEMARLLKEAWDCEQQAVDIMEQMVK